MFRAALGRSFAYQKRFKNWSILTGDTVGVVCGKHKGKIGEVVRVNHKTNQVTVANVNVVTQRLRGSGQEDSEEPNVKSGAKPIHVSNVNLIDPETGKPTRNRAAYLADGTKVRIAKRSGSLIPKPNREHLTYANRHKDKIDGALDTSALKTLEVTYLGEDFASVKREFMAHISEKERVEGLLVFDK